MMKNERLFLNNDEYLLREAVNTKAALKLQEVSDAYAILYGWKYKNDEEVEIEPEEHTEESLQRRLNQIVNDMSVYSQNNPKGNRYAYHKDFIFYILYNDRPYGIKTNENLSKFKCESYYPINNDKVELEYTNIEVYVDFNDNTKEIDWTYSVDKYLVEEQLFDYIYDDMSDEEKSNMSDDEIDTYINNKIDQEFDSLVEKYMDKLLDYFEDDAQEEAQENYEPDYGYDYDHDYEMWRDEQLLSESKKSKKKKKKNKKSKMQNSPVFSSINDLLKWVKKRQKGLPALSTLNPNAGNVEYNCAFFNHAMGSDGGSMSAMQGALSSGGGDAGVSSGGDAGGGMGECLHTTQKEIKNSLLNERVQMRRKNK